MTRPRRCARAGAWLLLTGCAAQSFQPRFAAEREKAQQPVVAELAAPKPRDERPVAVGITTDPMRLFAWDLSAGLLWERPVVAKSAPLVVADAIVLQEEQGVVVRDLGSGELRTVVDEQGALIGADGQGRAVVVSVAYTTANPRGAVALVEGDSVRFKQALDLPVGTPALSGRYVVVPWATQRVSVLAATDGRELARYHFTSTVMGRAQVDRGRLYLGQLGLLPVTSELLAHPDAKTSPYTPWKRELPAQPPLLADGYLPVADPDNAVHRLQLSWRIGHDANGPMTENDKLWLRFYRLLFALDADADSIAWVRTFDHDLVGAAVQPGGIFIADASGVLRFVEASGETRFVRQLGRALRVVAIRPGAWLPGPVVSPSEPVVEPPLGTLEEQLYAAAAFADDRLSAGRVYAVERLGMRDAPAVTAHLIALCGERKSPEPVRVAACARLSTRTVGGDDIVRALRQRASFLEDTAAPPVGALAQAAAKMRVKQAGPLLVSHAEDPNTPAADLAAVFVAMEQLGQRSAAPTLERFVRQHHAEPAGSELSAPLAAALHALGALRSRSARDTLADIARDPLTSQAVRDQAAAALLAVDAKPADKPEAAPEPAPEEPEEDEVQTDPRPYSLTLDLVRRTLTPLRPALGKCLRADASHPHSGRASLVIDKAGAVEGIFVSPATLQACVEPLLRNAKFPPTRLGRQRLTHVFHGPNATVAEVRAAKRKPAKAPKAR